MRWSDPIFQLMWEEIEGGDPFVSSDVRFVCAFDQWKIEAKDQVPLRDNAIAFATAYGKDYLLERLTQRVNGPGPHWSSGDAFPLLWRDVCTALQDKMESHDILIALDRAMKTLLPAGVAIHLNLNANTNFLFHKILGLCHWRTCGDAALTLCWGRDVQEKSSLWLGLRDYPSYEKLYSGWKMYHAVQPFLMQHELGGTDGLR